MELREFAEQVLFSNDLEDKLRIPGPVTDEHPGSALAAPDMPGRPKELAFKARGDGRDAFPGLNRLEKESERGRLLHFFANHELLATELMALVLLRFPDAPAAFRQGVFRTLKDEQRHTRLYLERMRTCGVTFGELPVSGFFWDSIATMENPVDYVAGLCLTFEQANLDFCRHYADAFLTVGDTGTGRLLDRIYRDEIGHVAYGLKWFRRWKNPDESDWEAFCRHLRFPLSPQRAKGIGFNRAGRREAGLEPDFINHLEVFARSKGRTPTVTFFNPLEESLLVRSDHVPTSGSRQDLVHDLENLPQFLCRQDDIVLVRDHPSVTFLQTVKRAGFALPEFIEIDGRPGSLAGKLAGRKLGGFRPWAWGPHSRRLLEPLGGLVGAKARTPAESFHDGITELYSKSWSADFLRSILARAEPAPWLCPAEAVGTTVSSLEQAISVIEEIRRRGHHRIVVKEAFGLAGQNAVRLWEPALTEGQIRWMDDALRAGPSLVIEPWFERVIDFSIQMEAGRERLRLCGHTGLLTDHRGHFRGNWAHPNHHRRLPPEVIHAIRAQVGNPDRIHELIEVIRRRLESEFRRHGYEGPVGIDAFLYREGTGGIRLKPVVEINPRHTMGRLTLELMRRVAPGRIGCLRLFSLAEVTKVGFSTFAHFAASLEGRLPLASEGGPGRKILSGALCLNDPARARNRLAVFAVFRDRKELGDLFPAPF